MTDAKLNNDALPTYRQTMGRRGDAAAFCGQGSSRRAGEHANNTLIGVCICIPRRLGAGNLGICVWKGLQEAILGIKTTGSREYIFRATDRYVDTGLSVDASSCPAEHSRYRCTQYSTRSVHHSTVPYSVHCYSTSTVQYYSTVVL